MSDPCDICGGSKVIRLPVRPRLSNKLCNDEYMMLDIRTYPCPECSNGISYENIKMLGGSVLISDAFNSAEFSEILQESKYNMVQMLAEKLCREGLVSFELGKTDPVTQLRKLHARIGILSPKTEKTFGERVKERQQMLASCLVNATIRRINADTALMQYGLIDRRVMIKYLYQELEKLKEIE